MRQTNCNSKLIRELCSGKSAVKLTAEREDLVEFLLNRHKLHLIIDKFFANTELREGSYYRDLLFVKKHQLMQLSQYLMQIMSLLKESEIEAIPLKGPVLASMLYGDIGNRHSGDLDLYVPRAQLDRAISVFEQLGYQLVSPRISITEKQWDFYFMYKNEMTLVHPRTKLYIELHTGLYNRGLLEKENGSQLLKDCSEYQFGGVQVKQMEEIYLFIYLSYHGAFHQYYRLFWLQDIDQAHRKLTLNHSEVLERSRNMGIERFVVLSIKLSNLFFGSPIPEAYESYLRANRRVINRLVRICESRICGTENLTFKVKIKRHYYLFLLKPSLRYVISIVPNIIARWYIRRFLGGH